MLTNPGASCVDDAAPVQGRPVNGFVPAGVFTRPDGGAGETGTGGAWGKTRELMGLTALSAELLAFCASEALAAVRTKTAEPISLREVVTIVESLRAANDARRALSFQVVSKMRRPPKRRGQGHCVHGWGGGVGARDDGCVLAVGLCVGATVAGRGGGGAGIFSRISWLEVCSISIWCTIWS
jgi:hypothetical protein